jgi:hypothetical protein
MVARQLICAIAMTAVAVGIVTPGTAYADDCSAGASTADNVLFTEAQCTDDSGTSNSNASATTSEYVAFRYEPVCFLRSAPGTQSDGCARSAPDTCRAGQTLYQVLAQLRSNGNWVRLRQFCRDDSPGLTPTVTPALVARAFQRIPLPALRAITQPADNTLINFDTIFYVQATPLHRTLNLLGQRVELAITPSTFRWVHGDGTTAVTHTAGAAYPAKDVVYRYQQAHVTVRQHVEIVWTARWSLNGGPYQDVDGTVTTVGPDSPLRIAEATPALSGYGH